MRTFFAAHGLTLHYDIEMQMRICCCRLPCMTSGSPFVPEKLVADALEQKKLFSIPLVEEIPLRYVCLVRDPGRPLALPPDVCWSF